jgi:hypothetical protein
VLEISIDAQNTVGIFILPLMPENFQDAQNGRSARPQREANMILPSLLVHSSGMGAD